MLTRNQVAVVGARVAVSAIIIAVALISVCAVCLASKTPEQALIEIEETLNAMSRPTYPMIRNDVMGALYIVADTSSPIDRRRNRQHVLTVAAECKKFAVRRTPEPYTILLHEHDPFPVGSLLITGPAGVDSNGQVIQGAALATKQILSAWNSCSH